VSTVLKSGSLTLLEPYYLSRPVIGLLCPYHSPNPFHNNHPLNKITHPYIYSPTQFRHYSTAVIICTLLCARSYIYVTVFVTMYIITCCNVKELCFPSADHLCVLHDTEGTRCLSVRPLLVLCDENTVCFLRCTNRFMEYYQNVWRPKSITTPPNDIFVTLYTGRYRVTLD
jgi:hypothetical protein